jgi:ceramide glucosyltransferase
VTPADAALLAWAAAVAAVSGVAAARSLRRPVPAATSRAPTLAQTLLVVRPCAGDEPCLALTLASLGALADLPGVRVRFAVATAADAAVSAIGTACERLAARGVDARLVVTHATGPNQKSDQLARVLAAEPDGATIVVVDSDVDLTAFDWDALLAPLADPRVAAVWAPPCEAPGATFGDRASEALLGGSLHAFPLLAGIDPHGLVGKVVAVRRAALDAIGGFAALGQHLGEDMELARRWRAAGARVVASRGVALSRAARRTPTAAAARYGRWLTVIRAQRPALLASYPALFFATPLIVFASTLAVVAGRAGVGALAAEALAVTARLTVGFAAARACGRPTTPLAILTDAVLADGLLAWAFARALRSRTVRWRGRALRVTPGGALHEVA